VSFDDAGGWAIFATAFQVPLFLAANGNVRVLLLVDVGLVLAAVIVAALVKLMRSRQEKAARARHAELTIARQRKTDARPQRALAAVPPLAANAFVIDAEREVS